MFLRRPQHRRVVLGGGAAKVVRLARRCCAAGSASERSACALEGARSTGLKGTETRIRPVSRSFFEFARPAPPRQPRWGSQTVHRARHLFREHCGATPAPMAHLRMAAGRYGELVRSLLEGIAANREGSARREIRIALKVLGRTASASREVYQSRPRVLRGRTEPEGLAGQAVDRNKCTLQGCADRTGRGRRPRVRGRA
jgi:hypothetical protein